ncbi:diguanylate cyclase domain-containing protein, partial [Novosphingobium lubricantis]
RLGGEEFLRVVTGVDVAGAALLLEDLRQAVAGHPGRPLTGELPVTVSLGVPAAAAGDTQGAVLARADEALYEAIVSGDPAAARATMTELIRLALSDTEMALRP